tara:strand:- start:121 stop:606 length:486 start_codon:yes stop_codon:yes gene_type:complete
MAKYLIFTFLFFFLGCEINSQQIIKPEKFNFDEIKFNTVTKKLIYDDFEENSDLNDMKKIINYWYDNKIKTNGFEGSLDVKIKKVDIFKVKETEYFKFSIDLSIEFIETTKVSNSSKIYIINASEYGEIQGNFSIKDQENLALNIMHQGLKSINKELIKIN